MGGRVRRINLLGAVSHEPVTRNEAAKLRARLVNAIQVLFQGIDWFVSETNGMQQDCEVWAVDDEEAETLADAWLSAAAVNARAAVGARIAAELADRYAVGAILLPRFLRTWKFYSEHGGMVLSPVPLSARRLRDLERRQASQASQTVAPNGVS